MNKYLLCYDIADAKRLYKVRKYAYSFAFGGQKSVLEVPASKSCIRQIADTLVQEMDIKEDKLNIIQIQDKPIILGKFIDITYDNGLVIL